LYKGEIAGKFRKEMNGSNCNGNERRYFGKKRHFANLMELTALMKGKSS
jgi:hypothetical protein